MKRNKFSKVLYTLFHVLLTATVGLVTILVIFLYCRAKCFWNKNSTVYKEFAGVSKIALWCLGVKYIIKGKIPENNERYIVVANHINWADAFKISAYFNGKPGVVFLDKKMFKYPILGWFLIKVNAISIDGKTNKGITHAYNESLRVLQEDNKHLFIFPEGTRTPDGNVSEFKRGAFSLALKTSKRIIPLGIAGAFEFSNKSTLLLNPGPVVVYTGCVIDVIGKNEEFLADITREAILSCIRNAEHIRNRMLKNN